ncbi:hypothetical protein Cantr_10127 [Candida viswanathii]|uniref:Uncharacterized protein n=1 Tax=Candida viswanathii TaxID=5486 RepID=A0A367YC42_9ASCO|nr:hypothetical protein Cantr_10127 [Candida viswanathii]
MFPLSLSTKPKRDGFVAERYEIRKLLERLGVRNAGGSAVSPLDRAANLDRFLPLSDPANTASSVVSIPGSISEADKVLEGHSALKAADTNIRAATNRRSPSSAGSESGDLHNLLTPFDNDSPENEDGASSTATDHIPTLLSAIANEQYVTEASVLGDDFPLMFKDARKPIDRVSNAEGHHSASIASYHSYTHELEDHLEKILNPFDIEEQLGFTAGDSDGQCGVDYGAPEYEEDTASAIFSSSEVTCDSPELEVSIPVTSRGSLGLHLPSILSFMTDSSKGIRNPRRKNGVKSLFNHHWRRLDAKHD